MAGRFPQLQTRARLVMALTEYDERQRKRDRFHNPHFLGIALEALGEDEVADAREYVLDRFSGRLADYLLVYLGLPKMTREENR